MSVRFYSLPETMDYPFLLVNRKNWRSLFKRKFIHAIIDSGVMDFVHKNVTNYPKSFLKNWGWKASELIQIWKDKVWFVIPDYPDDYNPNQFGDNVSKTVENIQSFLTEYPDVNWLPVIQSRYLNKLSFLESCEKVKKVIGQTYPRVAIGTVCKCNSLNFIEYCCLCARKHFPFSSIHAFGLTLSALPRVKYNIDSFDSMAWTFPRQPHRPSCKNKQQRIQYFNNYLHRINELLEMKA